VSKNKFGGNRANMGQIMKQAKEFEKMMGKMHEEAGKAEIESSSGGGAVKVIVTGTMSLKKISININDILDLDAPVTDQIKEKLEQSVAAAISQAINGVMLKSEQITSQAMGEAGQGFDMAKLLKQAQQIKAKIQDAKQRLADTIMNFESPGIVVNIRGDMKLMDISLELNKILNMHDDIAVSQDDVDMLQDLIIAAVNDAVWQAQQNLNSQMGGFGDMF